MNPSLRIHIPSSCFCQETFSPLFHFYVVISLQKKSFPKEETLTSKTDLQVYIITVLGGKRGLKQHIAIDTCVCDQEGCWFCIQKPVSAAHNCPVLRDSAVFVRVRELQSLILWAWNTFPSSSSLNNIKTRIYLTSLTKNLVLFLALCFLGEDASSFCASSVEQYYSWNIGKRRAAEVILSSCVS